MDELRRQLKDARLDLKAEKMHCGAFRAKLLLSQEQLAAEQRRRVALEASVGRQDEADQSVAVLRQELEQTKLVLHETIEAALERGQKIDDLIVKSNDLSGSSKMFYKTAKKQNQCCSFM